MGINEELTKRLRELKQITNQEFLEAEQAEAEAAEKKRQAAEKKVRLCAQPQDPEACPECLAKGIISKIVALPSPDPDKFDRMGCKTCGAAFNIPAG